MEGVTLRTLSIFILCLTFWQAAGWADETQPQEADAPAAAEDAAKPAPKKAGQPNLLDFDGDVIEGERQSPNLFLQLQVENPDLDVLLYQRKDFNDYHALEKDRRPVFRKVTQ
jgi:hypothetical protein